MTRVRTDNVFGTITNNPLIAAGTTLNSAGLANLAVVSSAEAIIVLDPNRLTGAPEIVVVTAHTGSATSATIVRGQFGTTAREHASGTEWVHAPIASNATSYVTVADDQGDYVPMNAWEPWTPTLTNLTVGNGTQVAKFQRAGRTIDFRWRFTLGSTSAVGTAVEFTLPVPSSDLTLGDMIGSVGFIDSGGEIYIGCALMLDSDSVRVSTIATNTTAAQRADITATAPFTWASGDAMFVTGRYEAAS